MEDLTGQIGVARDVLAAAATEDIRRRHPEWDAQFETKGWEATERDLSHTIDFLVASIELPEEEIIEDYLDWLIGLLESLDLREEHVLEGLKSLAHVAREHLHPSASAALIGMIDRGITHVQESRSGFHR